MRPLPDDIVEFIHQHFSASDVPKVIELLDRHELSTPRVRRALLYLSGGSLAMLQHYVASAALDVREILVRAEYVMNVSSGPMQVRSMADPFYPKRGDEPRPLPPPRAAEPAPPGVEQRRKTPRPAAPRTQHRHLRGLRFALGSADYVVSAEQQSGTCVRCYRKSGNVVTIVHLPLVFVMEQLSEHIDLGSATQ